MSVSEVHKLDGVLLGGSTFLTEAGNQKWDAGIQSLLAHPAGFVYPMFRANQAQKPALEFSTPQLATVLTALGVTGALLTGTVTYFKLASNTSNSARTSTVHDTITISSCLGYIESIRLPHNEKAEARVKLVCQYDGVNDPFVIAVNVALDSVLTASEYFTLGPVEINGTVVPGVEEVTIDFQVKLMELGANGEEFNTFVAIDTMNPAVTVKTYQRTNWETLGLRGSALNGTTGLVCYGRKFAAGGSRVANATASHVKFIGLAGSAIPVDSQGQETKAVSDTLKCELISGTEAVTPITFNAASAIT